MKKLLGNWVSLKIETKEKTASGIILPDSSEDYVTAEILSIGEGEHTVTGVYVKTSLQVGEVVLVQKSLIRKVKIDGETLSLCKESDIIAIY